MYHRFKWTKVSRRRNWISLEYEPLQPYFLLLLSRTVGAGCFVDVGANIGLYSVLMSQSVGRVIAYEANDALAKEIEKNFALNGIDGLVRRVAVSDHAGTVTFGIVSRYAGNSAVVEGATNSTDYSSLDTVESVRLDDELVSIAGPIVLKIDVEGHELSVLEGAVSTLSKKHCIIQIENFQGAVDQFFSELNYRKLTSIGPDAYFTNIDDIEPLETYELATATLIKANHEDKSMVLSRGDIGLIISGRVYEIVRKIALKLLGGKL
jgi:FkbM family methyltransferase